MDRFIVSSVLPRVLAALRRHPVWTWIGVLIYATAVTLPHENVQTVVGQMAQWMGRRHLYQLAGGIGIGGAIVLTMIILGRLRENSERRVISILWVVTLALIVATWRWLTANNTELIHYPQYIPEGMAILALTASPVESLAWVTLFGGIDECFQYWYLHGSWGIPYDFNDVYMDLLGGALGILLAAAFLNCQPASRESFGDFLRRTMRRPGVVMIFGIVSAGIALWASGKMLMFKDEKNPHYWFALSRIRPQGFWFFDETWGPHTFHGLLPLEGPLLILATLALYATLDRRVRISVKS